MFPLNILLPLKLGPSNLLQNLPPKDDSSLIEQNTDLNDDENYVANKQCPINCIRQENGSQNIL